MYQAPIQSKEELEATAKANGFKNFTVSNKEYEKFCDEMNRRD